MVVLIAGMPRSGSTFSFNVAREILSARGSVYQESCDDIVGAVGRSRGADHVIVKCHNLDAASLTLARAGAVRTIMTVRRIEDAVASWLEAFDAVSEPVALGVMAAWLTLYRELRKNALVVPYEHIDLRPSLAVLRIAHAICPSVSSSERFRITRSLSKATVKRQTDELSPSDPGIFEAGFSYWDTHTFFHRRHISHLQSRSAEQRLSPERLWTIKESLAPAIAAAGLMMS